VLLSPLSLDPQSTEPDELPDVAVLLEAT